MYAKKVRRFESNTFLIDTGGILQHEWRGVKVDGHFEAVMECVKTLKK